MVHPDHVDVEPEPYRGPVVELDSFEQFEVDLADPVADLAGLGSDDRPVVLEERDDALLPEPLPGEGVAFEGELLEGTVDGHGFDTDASSDAAAEPEAADEPAAELAEAEVTEIEATEAEVEVEDEVAAEQTGDDPVAELEVDASTDGETVADAGDAVPFVEALDGAADPGDEILPELDPTDGDEAEADDERGSLLRFLSTVKP
jgi:hypothetical protein